MHGSGKSYGNAMHLGTVSGLRNRIRAWEVGSAKELPGAVMWEVYMQLAFTEAANAEHAAFERRIANLPQEERDRLRKERKDEQDRARREALAADRHRELMAELQRIRWRLPV